MIINAAPVSHSNAANCAVTVSMRISRARTARFRDAIHIPNASSSVAPALSSIRTAKLCASTATATQTYRADMTVAAPRA
jgi:hypothetical protein